MCCGRAVHHGHYGCDQELVVHDEQAKQNAETGPRDGRRGRSSHRWRAMQTRNPSEEPRAAECRSLLLHSALVVAFGTSLSNMLALWNSIETGRARKADEVDDTEDDPRSPKRRKKDGKAVSNTDTAAWIEHLLRHVQLADSALNILSLVFVLLTFAQRSLRSRMTRVRRNFQRISIS